MFIETKYNYFFHGMRKINFYLVKFRGVIGIETCFDNTSFFFKNKFEIYNSLKFTILSNIVYNFFNS